MCPVFSYRNLSPSRAYVNAHTPALPEIGRPRPTRTRRVVGNAGRPAGAVQHRRQRRGRRADELRAAGAGGIPTSAALRWQQSAPAWSRLRVAIESVFTPAGARLHVPIGRGLLACGFLPGPAVSDGGVDWESHAVAAASARSMMAQSAGQVDLCRRWPHARISCATAGGKVWPAAGKRKGDRLNSARPRAVIRSALRLSARSVWHCGGSTRQESQRDSFGLAGTIPELARLPNEAPSSLRKSMRMKNDGEQRLTAW